MVGGGTLTAANPLGVGCQWEVNQGSAGVAMRKNRSEEDLADARRESSKVDLPGGTIYVRSLSDENSCGGDVVGDNSPPREYFELTVVALEEGDAAQKLPPGQTYCNVAAPGVQKLLEAMGWTK